MPESARKDALTALTDWAHPDGKDRLLNQWRPIADRGDDDASAAVAEIVRTLFKDAPASIQETLAKLAGKLSLASAGEPLALLALNDKAGAGSARRGDQGADDAQGRASRRCRAASDQGPGYPSAQRRVAGARRRRSGGGGQGDRRGARKGQHARRSRARSRRCADSKPAKPIALLARATRQAHRRTSFRLRSSSTLSTPPSRTTTAN